jgi:hypothetical protein
MPRWILWSSHRTTGRGARHGLLVLSRLPNRRPRSPTRRPAQAGTYANGFPFNYCHSRAGGNLCKWTPIQLLSFPRRREPMQMDSHSTIVIPVQAGTYANGFPFNYCHSRAGGNLCKWIPTFVGMTGFSWK